MGTRELTVLSHLESESVIEPNEEPTGIESLEWLYALEHDGETMASLTDATSNGIAAGVNMEVLKISKPIVSAGKMVRSGRRIVLDEHDSYIEDKKTGK